jgi:coproporphyrinogen III oxidase-like Fe-S oxidoreductase
MIVESMLTSYLKHKYTKLLSFDRVGSISPPSPRQGVDYLLYAHVPFCEELCPYCSFNRFPLDQGLARDYFDALTREIFAYKNLGFDFRAVYIGGGTPTVLPEELGRLMDKLRGAFSIREISVETNPNHLTGHIVSILKDAGVNRVSVGAQSFDDGLLKQMERYHKYGSGNEIRGRLESLMGVFDTLNVDMIFNFPTQTMETLERDVRIIEEIKADQVTFYPLMVSDLTRQALSARFGPISYKQEKAFYERIVEMLEGTYGFGTAWCFSRKKAMIDEYIVDYDEYVGAGSGAFGYVNGSCYANTFSLPQYLEAVSSSGLPLYAAKEFSPTEQIQYDFMMKLFGTTLDIARAEVKYGGRFIKTLRKEMSLFRLTSALVSKDGVLKLTRRGRYFWVIMMREFFSGVNNFREACRAEVRKLNESVEPLKDAEVFIGD